MKYLTLLCVTRDGRHLLYQTVDTMPGHAGVRIGAHVALRQRELGEDLATIVVIHGDTVTEHRPT